MYYLILKHQIIYQSKSYNKTLYFYNVIKSKYNNLQLQITKEENYRDNWELCLAKTNSNFINNSINTKTGDHMDNFFIIYMIWVMFCIISFVTFAFALVAFNPSWFKGGNNESYDTTS